MKDRKRRGPRPRPQPQPRPTGSGAGGSNGPQLGPEIQAKIGQQLRKIYEDMVSQGVPGRFIDLLDQLDKPKDSESR